MGKRRILLDTRLVKSIDATVTQRFWPATKYGKPVLYGDRVWESHGPAYGTVLHDQGKYRLWYNTGFEVPPYGNTYYVAYAESVDGIEWYKPDLAIQPFQGQTPTNLLNLIRHQPSVILDPHDPDPQQRYKAAGFVGVDQVARERGIRYPGNGYYLAHSSNGLEWTDYAMARPVGTTEDVSSFLWDARRGQYIANVKRRVRYNLIDRRSISIMTSPDFCQWSEPTTVLVPDALDDYMAHDRGYHHAEFYGMGWDPVEDFYVGFLWVFWVTEPLMPTRKARTGWWGNIDVQLIFSYDGFYWQRTPGRQSFIPLGVKGDFDGSMIQTLSRAIHVGDEIRIYYSGESLDHAYFVKADAQHTFDYRTDIDWKRGISESVLSYASIQRDRYASLSTGTQGSFVIEHGLLDGQKLEINARAPLGSVKAQLLDSDGNPLDGFGIEDCLGFTGDSLHGELSWRNKSLQELRHDQAIGIRFVLDYADIFAYEFVDI